MNRLTDKCILGVFVLLLLYLYAFPMPGVIILLGALTASALSGFFDNRACSAACIGGYLLACLAESRFCFGLPLVLYDGFFLYRNIPVYLALPVFLLSTPRFTVAQSVFCIAFFLISFLLRAHTGQLMALRKAAQRLRDESQEQQLHLEQNNRSLMEKQDYEIHLATLKERNRIAREIHDNVGHMLSRSILQTGAIMAVNRDESLTPALRELKGTLDSAMNSIRASVHNLHEEAIDLKDQMEKITGGFSFCSAQLSYDMESDPPRGLKYCFLAIVREGLSNVAKHSNASQVTVTLREHPALYQLVIHDNGTVKKPRDSAGIGLQNMEERVRGAGGTITIKEDRGFEIFISVPKEVTR